MALIAIFGMVAIPGFLSNARGVNEGAAIGAIRASIGSQELHKDEDRDGDGIPDYASTLDELAASDPEIAALFGPDPRDPDPEAASLGASQALHCCSRGYYFAILGTEPPPAAAFRMLAIPLSPATGRRAFAADETGLILGAVGHIPGSGDEIVDAGTGASSACGAGCDGPAPIPIPAEADLDARDQALLARSRSLILWLNQVAGGDGIPGAETLFGDPGFQPAALDRIDVADDGVGADDLTAASLLELAHALTPPGAPPGATLMDDATASAVFASYQGDIAELMDLSLYSPHASVPLTQLSGDPVAFLASLLAIPLVGGAGAALVAAVLVLSGARRLRRRPAHGRRA